MNKFKLNNHGWGLKEMLIISAILILFLLFVAYSIVALYHNLDNKAPVYSGLENTLIKAAIKYNAVYDSVNFITLQDLKEAEYIEIFTDSNDEECDGYVLMEDGDYIPYIKCKNYKTRGFSEEYLKK